MNCVQDKFFEFIIRSYEKGRTECRLAFEDDKASLAERVTRFVVGACLFIPVINICTLMMLQSKVVGWSELRWGESHFSCENIDFLVTQSLGLRHLSDRMRWLDESFDQGFQSGCSLSLAPDQAIFTEIEKKEWSEMSFREKEKFLSCFERGIDDFLSLSINYDLVMVSPNYVSEEDSNFSPCLQRCSYTNQRESKELKVEWRVSELVDHFANTCFFSVVDYSKSVQGVSSKKNHVFSVDHSSWGLGLGRIAKKSIEANCITRMSNLSREDFGFTTGDLRAVVTFRERNGKMEDVHARIIACYRKTLIDFIQNESLKQEVNVMC